MFPDLSMISIVNKEDWKMKEGAPVPSEIRLVSTMPFLEHLFVCFAKIKPQAGKLLKRVFSSGKNPPTKLKTALVR